jgi:DNA polymerase III subunit delta'
LPVSARDEDDEPDRVEGQSHPRETYELIGQDTALQRASRAIRSGRPPQAWLISGPPGTGKATLAYRIARYVLRYGATSEGLDDLAVAPKDPVSRQIEAEAYPGLLVLKRRRDDKGKLKTVINVDEIRRLGPFFGLTSGAGGWRVAIIDPADEMNDNAANALLKVLEEPPPRGLLMLVSHAPGRLLPTIRSRCQRLDLKPLDELLVVERLAVLIPDTAAEDRESLARLSEGSLGLALRLAGEDGLKLARDAESLLEARGAPDISQILSLAERVARAQDGLDHFGEFLAQAISRRIRARAQKGESDRHAITLWEEMHALYDRALGIHMEPRQTVIASALKVAEARRRGTI